jgi:serine/threonine-protein kinase RsbW
MSAERSILQGQSRHADLSLSRTLDGNLPAISAGLQEMFSSDLLMALSEGSRGTVEIVLAEALNNIVEHAYANYAGSIEIRITPGDGFLFVKVVDSGLPMPGEELPGGRLGQTADIQDLQEGGFGWYLIRSLSQELTYLRDGNMNILSFCVGVDYGP